jgi:hypothetical protein
MKDRSVLPVDAGCAPKRKPFRCQIGDPMSGILGVREARSDPDCGRSRPRSVTRSHYRDGGHPSGCARVCSNRDVNLPAAGVRERGGRDRDETRGFAARFEPVSGVQAEGPGRDSRKVPSAVAEPALDVDPGPPSTGHSRTVPPACWEIGDPRRVRSGRTHARGGAGTEAGWRDLRSRARGGCSRPSPRSTIAQYQPSPPGAREIGNRKKALESVLSSRFDDWASRDVVGCAKVA